MHRLLHVLRRMSTASPREWRCRTRQLMFAAHNVIANFRGKSALSPQGHLNALRVQPGEIAAWWKARRNCWFMDVEREIALQGVAQNPDSQLPWVLRQADLVVSGQMPLFSFEPVDFTGTDRWQRDFVLKKTSPRRVYPFVRYLDVDEVGDSKHVWEPNRFGWAVWLGLAHRITRERKYAHKFAEMTSDWFDQNPYPVGINYCSALELAMRNYAWLWALDLFSDYLAEDVVLLDRLLHGVWVGCKHIESNLSHFFAPNTHILGEGFALFATGAAIPDFANAPRWRLLGQSILASEAQKQFHDDGTHRELSSGYHIYATDFYLHAVLIAMQCGFQIPPILLRTARRAGARLAELAPHDLVLPQWNDCDGGRLLSLVPDPLDAGPSLIATQILNGDLSLVPDRIPSRGFPLLMVPRQSCPPENVPLINSHSQLNRNVAGLVDSGIVAYTNEVGDYVLFRASPFGYLECPHSHDAPLSVIIHLAGQSMVVDSGTGAYTQGAELRNRFRSSPGKNTMLVNGRGPSRPSSAFEWERTTDCELVLLKRFSDGMRAKGRHAGFSDPPNSFVFVQREVIVLASGIVAIVDRWDTDSIVPVRVAFTLHPDLELDAARQMLHIRGTDRAFHFFATSLHPRNDLECSAETVPFSPNYGKVGVTSSLAFEAAASRQGIVTIFSRVGKITALPDGKIRFGEDDRIRLVITERGIEPMSMDVKHELEDIQVK